MRCPRHPGYYADMSLRIAVYIKPFRSLGAQTSLQRFNETFFGATFPRLSVKFHAPNVVTIGRIVAVYDLNRIPTKVNNRNLFIVYLVSFTVIGVTILYMIM